MKGGRIFGSLAVIALSVSFLGSVIAAAASDSESIGISGKVTSAAPTAAATIDSPINGTHFKETPITVSGTCQDGLLLKLFRNGSFSGSTYCQSSAYSLSVNIFSGRNDLIAKVYDDLDQAGPDSNTVTVYLDTASGLLLSSNYAKRGANPGDELQWPLTISGGNTPYAIHVDWGDGDESLISLTEGGDFTAKHIYDKSGVYEVVINATDKDGLKATLQLVAIANGSVAEQSAPTTTEVITKYIWWPMAITTLALPVCFWLGRRHQAEKDKSIS